jgi:hypothetical protein
MTKGWTVEQEGRICPKTNTVAGDDLVVAYGNRREYFGRLFNSVTEIAVVIACSNRRG